MLVASSNEANLVKHRGSSCSVRWNFLRNWYLYDINLGCMDSRIQVSNLGWVQPKMENYN